MAPVEPLRDDPDHAWMVGIAVGRGRPLSFSHDGGLTNSPSRAVVFPFVVGCPAIGDDAPAGAARRAPGAGDVAPESHFILLASLKPLRQSPGSPGPPRTKPPSPTRCWRGGASPTGSSRGTRSSRRSAPPGPLRLSGRRSRTLYATRAERLGKPAYGDKTPRYVGHLPELLARALPRVPVHPSDPRPARREPLDGGGVRPRAADLGGGGALLALDGRARHACGGRAARPGPLSRDPLRGVPGGPGEVVGGRLRLPRDRHGASG